MSQADIVDLRKTRDEGLLTLVYNRIYAPHFSGSPDESVSFEECKRAILTDSHPVTHCAVYLLDSNPVGFAFFEMYPKSKSCLLTFIAVLPQVRGQGVFKKLVQKVTQTASDSGCSDAVFAECHDPALVELESESMDPVQRLRAFSAACFSVVPVHYVQPALSPGQQRSRKLLLLAAASSLRLDTVQRFCREFYETLGVRDLDGDPDLLALSRLRDLEDLKHLQVPIWCL